MNASVSRQRGWQKRNPDKARAHYLLTSALRTGALSRPSACEGCGASCAPHGHHDDYSLPLSVRWLCAQCHADAHAKRSSEPTVAVGVRLRKDLLGEVNRLAKSSKQSRNRTMAHLIEVGLSKAA